MNPVILYAVHIVLAAGLTMGLLVPRRWRRLILVIAATTGCLAGIGLAIAAGDETVWRSTTLGRPEGTIAGVAVACAWLLAGARGDERTLGAGALVGVASGGMVLAVLGDWVVPALVLWLASSFALVALVSQEGPRAGALLAIGVSDLALVGALALSSLDERVWTMPQTLEGLPLALALVSFVVRSGAVPLTGVWETLDSPAAPALPLMLGGPLALLGAPLSEVEPWFAAVALLVALGIAGAILSERETRLSLLGSWPVWLALGSLVVSPAGLQPAALGSLLAVTVVALWPGGGLGRAARGLLLGYLPPMVGWVALVATATRALDRAGAIGGSGRSLAWSLIAGLLLLTVAAGVALGSRAALVRSSRSSEVRTTVAAGALLVAGASLGIASLLVLEPARDLLGELDRVLILGGVALVAALAAAAIVYRRPPVAVEGGSAETESIRGSLVYSEDRADIAVAVGVFALVAVASLAAVTYLALEGLSYGFLPPRNL